MHKNAQTQVLFCVNSDKIGKIGRCYLVVEGRKRKLLMRSREYMDGFGHIAHERCAYFSKKVHFHGNGSAEQAHNSHFVLTHFFSK